MFKRFILALFAMALLLPFTGKAQDDIEFHTKFINELIAAGFKDYADKHLFNLKQRPGFAKKMEVAQARLLIAQRDLEGALAIAQKLGATREADDIKLMVADYYFAMRKVDEAKAIYDAYFKKYKTPPNDEAGKQAYQEAAFKYGGTLENIGEYQAAVEPMQLAIKAGLPPGVERRLMVNIAKLYNLAALDVKVTKDPKTKKARTDLATKAYKICEDIQFKGVDLYFGQSIGIMAQSQMILGQEDKAIATLQNAKKEMLLIEKLLKEQGFNVAKESPMASARFMLGEIYLRRAKAAMNKAADKKAEFEKVKKPLLQPAINEFHNVFKFYMASDWGAQAGLKKQEIIDIVDQYGKGIEGGGSKRPTKITRDIFKVADNLFSAKKYPKAIENYLQVLNLYPDADVAPFGLNNLLVCYTETKQDLMVKTTAKYIGDHFGGDENAAFGLLTVGRQYIVNKNPPMYLFIYDNFIENFPDHEKTPQVVYTLAGLAARDGFPNKEQEYMDLLITKYSDSEFYIKTLSKKGYDNYNAKNYVQAAADLRDYIKVEKPGFDKAQALFFMADCVYKQEKYSEAKKVYDLFLKWVSDPQSPYRNGPKDKELNQLMQDAQLFRALSLSKMKEPADQVATYRQEAIQSFENILKLYPKSPNAPKVLQAMGAVYLEMDDTENAAKAFNRIAKDYPDSPEAKNASFLIIDANIKIGRVDAARAEFKKMMANSQLFTPEKFLLIGEQMREREFYPEARQSYEKVLQKSKDNDDLERARFGAGQAAVEMGDNEGAIKMLNELLEKSPKTGFFYDAKFLLGRAYSGAEQFDKARESITDVSTYAKDQVNKTRVNLELGKVQMMEDDFKGALASFSRIAMFITDPKNPDLRPIYKDTLLQGVDAAEKAEDWAEGIMMIDTFKDYFGTEDDENMTKLQAKRREFNRKKVEAEATQ